MNNHPFIENIIFVPLTILGLFIISCLLVHAGEPVSKENHPSIENEDYWTPERLKDAKPLELPHPSDPPPITPSLPNGTSPSQPPSVEAPGSQGQEGIVPDKKKNLFMEETQKNR